MASCREKKTRESFQPMSTQREATKLFGAFVADLSGIETHRGSCDIKSSYYVQESKGKTHYIRERKL